MCVCVIFVFVARYRAIFSTILIGIVSVVNGGIFWLLKLQKVKFSNQEWLFAQTLFEHD